MPRLRVEPQASRTRQTITTRERTPAELVAAWSSKLCDPARMPASFLDLLADGPCRCGHDLEAFAARGHGEYMVVLAFLEALLGSPAGQKLARLAQRQVKAAISREPVSPALRGAMKAVFGALAPERWPVGTAPLAIP